MYFSSLMIKNYFCKQNYFLNLNNRK